MQLVVVVVACSSTLNSYTALALPASLPLLHLRLFLFPDRLKPRLANPSFPPNNTRPASLFAKNSTHIMMVGIVVGALVLTNVVDWMDANTTYGVACINVMHVFLEYITACDHYIYFSFRIEERSNCIALTDAFCFSLLFLDGIMDHIITSSKNFLATDFNICENR